MAEPSLGSLQRWMQAIVVHPGSIEDAVETPAAAAEIPDASLASLVLPSRTLSPVERLGIYHSMYLLRLAEALTSDYPSVHHYLGDHGFRELARRYLVSHPSRSYTLNRLGDHFPAFIQNDRLLPRRAFLHDLARLELAMTEVFDAVTSPPLDAAALSSVPDAAWPRARMIPIEAFRLIATAWPASKYFQSVKDESEHPPIRRKAEHVAVFRRGYAVRRLDLTRPAFELLSELAGGRRLGKAIERVLERRRFKPEDAFRWFRDWIAAGVFREIELADGTRVRPEVEGRRS